MTQTRSSGLPETIFGMILVLKLPEHSLNQSLFRPGPDVEDITFYYACDGDVADLPAKNKFFLG